MACRLMNVSSHSAIRGDTLRVSATSVCILENSQRHVYRYDYIWLLTSPPITGRRRSRSSQQSRSVLCPINEQSFPNPGKGRVADPPGSTGIRCKAVIGGIYIMAHGWPLLPAPNSDRMKFNRRWARAVCRHRTHREGVAKRDENT